MNCVCGHPESDHWREDDPENCCDFTSCRICPDCMIFHTEPTDPKLVEEIMTASGFVRDKDGDWV